MHKTNYDKDAAGFAPLFAADAAVFSLAPPLVHRGVDLREKQAWFKAWDGPVELKARDFEVTVSGDFAFCHGFMHMRKLKVGRSGDQLLDAFHNPSEARRRRMADPS